MIDYYLIKQDLNEDGQAEYVLIKDKGTGGSAQLWHLSANDWQFTTMDGRGKWNDSDIKQHLNENDLKMVPQRCHRLKIGDTTFGTYNQ